MAEKKHTITVLVENHAGVLSKVSGLFSRRGFNIDSLAVGQTENPLLSRITIVATGDEYTTQQIEKQLNKMIPVIKVKVLKSGSYVSRMLTLFKVSFAPSRRAELLQLADMMGAKIADAGEDCAVIELCDTYEKTMAFEDLLKPYGLREVARTGSVAIEKAKLN
ncbi:MAG: acetolactate synthase small subunit [Clostridia bacterium]|nr:acetolactate synthase small subunit [Clostridia bacterium]